MKKILFYYHQFGGLGHGMRIYSICKALKTLQPDYRLFVLNSGRPQPELGINRYAKVIDLPPLKAKQGLFSGLDSPEGLEITLGKRRQMLKLIAFKVRPDLAVFEHFPFGRDSLEQEITEFIKILKREDTLIYSSTRDIIAEPIALNALLQRQVFFDGLFIHSDKDTGFVTEFKQPAKIKKKLIFTGRVFPEKTNESKKAKAVKDKLGCNKNKLIVISIGGGIDGIDIIEKLIKVKEEIDKKVKTFYMISTGPAISKQDFDKIDKQVKGKDNIKLVKFISDYPDYVAASDLYISMGGYNSVNNCLATSAKTIVFARQYDEEQKLRAKIFSRFINIGDRDWPLDALASKVVKLVTGKPKKNKYKQGLNGAENTAKLIERALNLNYIKIRLTGKCNCSCDMCSVKFQKRDLDFKKVKDAIHQAKLLGVEVINFTGGEPTVYPYLFELMQYVKNEGMKFSLSTNGAFDKKMCRRIVKFADSVDISLDSYQSKIHDKIRGLKGSFDAAVSNIKSISKHGKILHINVTVRPDNFISIHKIVPLLAKYIDSVSFTLVDTSINKLRQLELKRGEIEHFYFKEVPLILKECMIGNIRLTITPFFTELADLSNKQRLEKFLKNKKRYLSSLKEIFEVDPEKECFIARQELRINSDGQICPCCYLDDYPVDLGNIHSQGLLGIVSSRKYLDFILGARPNRGWCKKCRAGYRIYSKFF